ncbi:DUF2075 domain-containing protein [Nonomuraea sp. NBC_01738]|uniref:DUF2075 domain-containing protein n=1 Tax=Nonomuraea sp. NBC_01738 TaxID=2976003 RepID=UPI002E0F1312|nr:DUF2075 domain-containing protein [Nonomuraea sp. NBC_01738]
MKVGLQIAAGTLVASQVEWVLRQLLDHVPGAGKAEQNSWKESPYALATVLMDADLAQVQMLIECRLGRHRVDVVLAGVDHSGRDTYVAVELKRWRRAELVDEDDDHVRVPSLRGTPRHPLVQVKGYCESLLALCGALHGDPERLGGVAYLHNAEESAVWSLFAEVKDEHSRLFTHTTRGRLQQYLRERFASSPGAEAAERLLRGAKLPSKALLQHGADILRGRDHFTLSPSQRVAYDQVAAAVEAARRSRTRQIVAVTGGPGSGKSAIALQLLADFGDQGREAAVVTGSHSFTESLRRYVGKNGQATQLFRYFNSFVDDRGPDHVLLICDEAHRLRRTSKLHPSQKHRETGRPQIEELVNAAYVPLFLLDEHQVVRPDEIGSLREIENYAMSQGLSFNHVHLNEQFRCGGSLEYDQWVGDLLSLPANDPSRRPRPWPGDERFQVLLAETPQEMDEFLRERLRYGNTARITAGFCWPWSPPSSKETLVADIDINGWTRPWNVKGDRKVGRAPAQAFWAMGDGGFDQVGCIYTAQGFEFDWAGVIIGRDLIARNGRFQPDRKPNRDPMINKRSVDDAQFDVLVRNVYKVLLTRGLVGMVIYAVDDETREFLGSLIPDRVGSGSR